jgi:glycosyltransferase involved in cell wall biosynthesis
MENIELSIVIPCLNEAATVGSCVRQARQYLTSAGIVGEILVADNGSTDSSRELAQAAGARVVTIFERGYGAAISGGIAAAKGRYVIMGDADESYDFSQLDAFIIKLRNGFELVMGNRFEGGIEEGAMPFLHRYLGNPVLSYFGRLFFKINIGDFHCGLRGFNREAILKMDLQTSGMELASEMVVKAALADKRGRPPHLRTWRDGWRHLRFLLTFSPRWLFLYPGISLFIVGSLMQAVLFHSSIQLGSFGLDIHTMLYSSAMTVIGVQMIWFAVFANLFGTATGLLPRKERNERLLGRLTLERVLAVGLVLFACGFGLSFSAINEWASVGYGELDPRAVMRTAIPSVSMILTGMEFCIASFFIGLLRTGQQQVQVASRRFMPVAQRTSRAQQHA